MIANAEITFFRPDGSSFTEQFCDPYIYLDLAGNLWHWNDHEWHMGMRTWGGRVLPEGMLTAAEASDGGRCPALQYPAPRS